MRDKLKVNKVVFLKHNAWYLSIVRSPEGKLECYWSFHDRTGMTDAEARTAFTREHFYEVNNLLKTNYDKQQVILSQ